jgi:hypothetical protein
MPFVQSSRTREFNLLSLSLTLTCSFLHVLFYHSMCRSPRPDNNGRKHSQSSTGIADHQKHVEEKAFPCFFDTLSLQTSTLFSKESLLFFFFLLFVFERDFKPRLRYMGMELQFSLSKTQQGKFQPDLTLFTTTTTQQALELSINLSLSLSLFSLSLSSKRLGRSINYWWI